MHQEINTKWSKVQEIGKNTPELKKMNIKIITTNLKVPPDKPLVIVQLKGRNEIELASECYED